MLGPFLFPKLLRSFDIARPRRLIQSEPRLVLRSSILTFALHATAERNEIAAKVHERSGGDRAGQRLGNPHHSDISVDRTIEREILCQRIDEH